jgi:hypothetical protein
MFWQTIIKKLVELLIKSQFLLVSGLPTGLWFLETALGSLKARSFHIHGRSVRTSRIRSIARWNGLVVGLNWDTLEQCGLVFHIENTKLSVVDVRFA